MRLETTKKEPILPFRMRDIEHFLSSFFSIGFTNKEILSLLVSQDCFIISVMTLKRNFQVTGPFSDEDS